MKKVILGILFLSFVGVLSAQNKVNWRIEGGIGSAGWFGDNSDDTDPAFSYRLGAGIDKPFNNNWGLRTGLYLNQKGGEMEEFEDGYRIKITVEQRYLEVPVMATYRLPLNKLDLVFGGGAYMAYGVGGKTKMKSQGIEVSIDTFGSTGEFSGLKRFDAGFCYDVGLDFGRWFLNINSQLGLVPIDSDAPQNLSLTIGAGIKF